MVGQPAEGEPPAKRHRVQDGVVVKKIVNVQARKDIPTALVLYEVVPTRCYIALLQSDLTHSHFQDSTQPEPVPTAVLAVFCPKLLIDYYEDCFILPSSD